MTESGEKIRTNWIAVTESQLQSLADLGLQLKDSERQRLLDNPALEKFLLECRDDKGHCELIFEECIDPEKVPEPALNGRKVYSSRAFAGICFTTLGRRALFFMETYEWVGASGMVEGARAVMPEYLAAHGDKELSEHEDCVYLSFFAIQYLLHFRPIELNERKEYRKGIKSNLPLAAPFTKPGKVRVSHFKGDISKVQVSHRNFTEWHCPAWGVRGHYRHYRDGRISYVKSYIKGKLKEEYQGREYVLFRED
jgi:hypothetical protein